MAKKSIWDILKIIGKWVLIAAGAILLLLGIKKGVAVVEGLFGKVQQPKNWTPVPNDPTEVAVTTDAGTTQIVQLPKDATGKQVTSDKVAAVGLDAKSSWTVETKAENVFGG